MLADFERGLGLVLPIQFQHFARAQVALCDRGNIAAKTMTIALIVIATMSSIKVKPRAFVCSI